MEEKFRVIGTYDAASGLEVTTQKLSGYGTFLLFHKFESMTQQSVTGRYRTELSSTYY